MRPFFRVRFRVGTLLAVTTVISIPLAMYSSLASQVAAEKRAIEAIRAEVHPWMLEVLHEGDLLWSGTGVGGVVVLGQSKRNGLSRFFANLVALDLDRVVELRIFGDIEVDYNNIAPHLVEFRSLQVVEWPDVCSQPECKRDLQEKLPGTRIECSED